MLLERLKDNNTFEYTIATVAESNFSVIWRLLLGLDSRSGSFLTHRLTDEGLVLLIG